MILLATLLAAAAAPNGPTALSCDTNLDGTPMHLQITLNEQQGTADIVSSLYGGTDLGRRVATFTPSSVQFLGYTLSRVNLSIVREAVNERGQCRIERVPARAF